MNNKSILCSDLAEIELQKLFKEFDENKYIYPDYPTAPLFKKVGNMFGIMVCKNKNNETIILKAFSGQFQGSWIVPSFVPPLLDVESFDKIVNQFDPKTKELTRIIRRENDDIIKKQLEIERKELSQEALDRILESYKITTIDKENLEFKDLFKQKTPPSGTGDCCAPKLFNYAFNHDLTPISLAEGFYGKNTNNKKHLEIYPPCREKCSLILPHMLKLDILYCDEHITVVNKPAGIPTIPGKKLELKDSITTRVKTLFPGSIEMSAAHRLDMDTSGLLVLGRTKMAHRNLSIQFQNREVEKEYTAIVRGIVKEEHGIIELPMRLDINNRPTQIIDYENGKSAKTEFFRMQVEKLNNENGTRLRLKPFTGRTHQLRVHCKEYLFPIVGDRLYGKRKDGENRMLLHAHYLSFFHPITNEKMSFHIKSDF